MKATRILLTTLGLLAVAGVVLGSSPTTAMADDDWHRHWEHDRGWHEHRDWDRGYYGRGYYGGYYAPPVVVAPAPYGYYAPPPVYYNPGVTFGFTFR